MEILIFWIVLCVIVGVAAARRFGRSGLGWFAVSFLISPVLGFLLLLALGPPKPKAQA